MIAINGWQFFPHWGEDTLRAIAEAYRRGDRLTAICKQFRCSRQTIWRVRDAFGLTKRPHGGATRWSRKYEN